MEKDDKTYLQKQSVHKILAHSYIMYFVLFLVGVIFNLIFNIEIFSGSLFILLGFVSLLFGTILILWAQYSSHNLKIENVTKETFCGGPYNYSRSPTNFGIFFMMFGFGMIVNNFFIVLFMPISFIIARFYFLNKEEKVLVAKYGDPYMEYKKIVKF